MSLLALYRHRSHQRSAEAGVRAHGSRAVSEAKPLNARFDSVDPRTVDPGGGVVA